MSNSLVKRSMEFGIFTRLVICVHLILATGSSAQHVTSEPTATNLAGSGVPSAAPGSVSFVHGKSDMPSLIITKIDSVHLP
ncbi:unnamed protein product [Protopolystoma xenopodis]|uniref:Uncharacterized protein n=1 Tax=Protopolystoma xenopodis TaxID=117903 RepID=A0A3S5CR65_9PLAT|nr:unnamed protein product [Protopolystoma xenopodis]